MTTRDDELILTVASMGLENAVFQIEGGGGLGLTYVIGALVKVGQLIVAATTTLAPPAGPEFPTPYSAEPVPERRAVTRRASTIVVSEPALRRHAVAIFGQVCPSQLC